MILTRDGKEIVAIYKQDRNEVDEVKDANGRLVYANTREITGTLPLSFSSRGKPLSDYRISGNAVQDGTPTPDAPVDVVGCGVRTGNLFDAATLENGIYLAASGAKYGGVTNGVRAGTKINASPNTAYTLSAQSSKRVSLRICEWSNGTFTMQTPAYNISGNVSLTVTTDAETTEIAFNIEGENGQYATNIMLNLGTTALPYEPYGYKLPLTINGTESPIYLGEAQTTRRIKKLVLTGEENWLIDGGKAGCYSAANENLGITAPIKAYAYQLSSHFVLANSYNTIYYNTGYFVVTTNRLIISYFAKSSVESFKSYLRQQYQNGTPVTVWYVLAGQETGIVNEPLMKIGNYADTITMAQAGVTIPTVSGTNVLDMSSPVKPSEVYIKGKGIRAIT